jgi:hypothetical protein
METGTRSHREWDTKTVRRQPTPPPQRSVAHPSRSLAAMTPADVLHLQRLAGNGAVTRYLRRFADLGAVVQREASVEGDPKKLDFMVSRFGDQLKAVFVNATEDQVGTAVRLADAKWRAAYAGAKEKLTRTSATAALDKKEILEALGKTDKELSSQASYLLLTNALTGTFSDEATVWYGYKPAKMAPVPLGSTPALDILQQKGTIEPEDKHADHRLQNSANDNIVKTGADTASTATALYTLENAQADERIKADGQSWELHAHVTQDGAVDFAHTKADAVHKFVVNDWFEKNIDVSERQWSPP